ncbi:hypothetical protein QO198_12230 [Pseudoalteromonas distincta]|uniref:ApeA N-terminal domain 1-containing protein n=1 Tax=Pseudoalteromonas distincta TaxID=77608 RepID=UPI00352E73DB
MSKEVYSAFKEHEFFGEFFHTETSYEARFAGKVYYSTEEGLTLEYNIADSDVPNECEELIGVLNNGKKCTLIGPFNFNYSGQRFGAVHTKFGKHGFTHLLIGDFVKFDTKFHHCRFTFHHMQEFFYPQGHIGKAPYIKGALEKISGEDWSLELENRATFKDVTHDLINLMRTEQSEAIEQLSLAFEGIKNKHPDESFLYRNTLEFLFKYEANTPKTSSELSKNINRISSLFSIFMDRPTFPDEVKLFPNIEAKNPVCLLSSIHLESRTVDLAKSSPSHFFMPINRNKVDLSKAISTWLDLYENYRVLSTTFQYETNYRTLHSAYSDVILFATNIESVANDLGMNTSNKYEGPIDKYGSEELKKALNSIFSKHNNKSLGTNISDLRNELAHVGRPKKLIQILDINDYVSVGRILKLIVVSHLLEKLGISFKNIHDYQNKLLPSIGS